MERNSFRELKMWEAFWQEELKRPDRHDMYLMKVAQTVKVSFAGGCSSLMDFYLAFDDPRPKYKTREEAAAASKARWGGRREAHRLAVEHNKCLRPN